MHDIPFVDAHIHLWDLSRLRYPWLTPPFAADGPNGSVEAIAQDYRPADYRADAAHWTIAGAVHVDAGADPRDALAETQWLESQGDAAALPTAIVAFADLADRQVDTLLAAHARHPRVRGIRQIVNWHADPVRTYTPRDIVGDAAWQAGYARLGAHGLSVDLQCYPDQRPAFATLAARHPEVPVMINHLGMPVPTDAGGREAWAAGLCALAALPHVAIKLSGFGFVQRPWSVAEAREWAIEAIDIFGTDRAMVASDFPTDRLFGTFDATLGAYAEILSVFAPDERRAMWGGNANRLYRLGLTL